jgi:5-(carboxyamino)imidazole ribonucleotide mutase
LVERNLAKVNVASSSLVSRSSVSYNRNPLYAACLVIKSPRWRGIFVFCLYGTSILSKHSYAMSQKSQIVPHSLAIQVAEPQDHTSQTPLVGIIMGSDSDLPTMQEAAHVCIEFSIPFEIRVISAHRTPADMAEYASTAHTRGLRVIVAGAGGAAHLPGMVAAYSPLPVIGVPILSKALSGIDSLLSIVQMPAGVPVATVAIGAGKNAGLLAVQMLAAHDEHLQAKVIHYKERMADESRQKNHGLATVLTA